jgi:uncharacterized membrane protein
LKKTSIIIAILSLLGFIDATYLTIEHYLKAPLPCSIFHGCDLVTHSQYSMIFGIPISLIGALYYLIILICAIAYLDMKKDLFIKGASALIVFGFIVSAFLVYLQLFVLKSICLYCMTSALICTLLFISSLFVFKKFSKTPAQELNIN